MINLAGEWKMRAEYLDVGIDRWTEVAGRPEGPFSLIVKPDTKRRMPSRTGFLNANLPCDVMEPLIAHGLMNEPLTKTHSDDCLWTDSLSWWFMRDFELPQCEYEHEQVRMFIETLDYNADIAINGRHVASHKNAFRPFDMDVKAFLRPGVNQIILRLTGGYELHHPQDALSFYNTSLFGQRVYLRKPQFTHGWDWCKPVPTCGTAGRMTIEGVSGAVPIAPRCETVRIEPGRATLALHISIDNLSLLTADDATLCAALSFAGETVYEWQTELYLRGGISYVSHEFQIGQPNLWWPNGSGAQPLYDLSLSVTCRGATNACQRKVGIRTIALCMDKLEDGSRKFDVMVNGQKIFMKGGNWVPADSLYLRVTQEKYRALVSEAAACNSNMLRVWGGGLYEPDCFYDACSEHGILIMQDFMYACGFYPDHLALFMHEAALEADYQTKRLSHQACLAIWTGNNEIHESFSDWYGAQEWMQPEALEGGRIFNYLLPETVQKNSPCVPYMPSSPFYGNKANDILAGDCHLWSWTRPDRSTGFKFLYELEAMDRQAAAVRFSSEYGFYGALMLSSVERYHEGEPMHRDGAIFIHHGERTVKHIMIDPMLRNHVAEPDTLGVEDYLLFTGVAQGLMYEELVVALRRRPHCSGNLIWMYNDCWPETGWSVIDYYLTRKISFYYLKRAYAPRRLIARIDGGRLRVCALNDAPEAVALSVEVGYMGFAGGLSEARTIPVEIDPHGRLELELDVPDGDLQKGACYARANHPDFAPVTSLRSYYRDFDFPNARVEIVSAKAADGGTELTLRADAFVPVAWVRLADDTTKLSDNFFPLLPGMDKHVWIDAKEAQAVVEPVRFERGERAH